MKNKILLGCLVAAALLPATSCSDFLTEDPKGKLVPDEFYSNQKELNMGVYALYAKVQAFQCNSNPMIVQCQGDDVTSTTGSNKGAYLSADAFEVPSDTKGLDDNWRRLYTIIEAANMIIDNAPGASTTQEEINIAMGQAYYWRAFSYFNLVRIFGPLPINLHNIPDNNQTTLTSVEGVYGQIVADLTAAENCNLPAKYTGDNRSIEGQNLYVSQQTVKATMAAVYMAMAGYPLNDPENPDEDALEYYEEALLLCNEVISSGKHSLNTDYQQIFINHVEEINDLQECIWEVGMYGNKIGAEDLAGSVGVENGVLCRDESLGYSGGPMTAQKKLFYAFGEGDQRRDWAIADYQINYNSDTETSTLVDLSDVSKEANIWKRNPGKWRRVGRDLSRYESGTLARLYTATNFPLMRYSDVLLMKAEAINATDGPTDVAYEAVNQVRRRAYGKPLDTPDATCDLPSGLSKEEFQQAVEDERFREFCFEGIRKWDLIRWGIYVETMQDLAADVMATAPEDVYQYCARAGNNTTERNVLFPIPNTELTVNKLMTQNPGW